MDRGLEAGEGGEDEGISDYRTDLLNEQIRVYNTTNFEEKRRVAKYWIYQMKTNKCW